MLVKCWQNATGILFKDFCVDSIFTDIEKQNYQINILNYLNYTIYTILIIHNIKI